MTRIPVITVQQPFAALIICGAKPFETRPRMPPKKLLGQRIGIHAGKSRFLWKGMSDDVRGIIQRRLRAYGLPSAEELPTGQIIGTVALIDGYRCGRTVTDRTGKMFAIDESLRYWPEPAPDLYAQVDPFGDYSSGRC